MRHAPEARLSEAMQEPQVTAIILTGAAEASCAGGDISVMGDPLEVMRRRHLLHPLVKLVLRGPKPVIAAVERPAFGAGWSLSLDCDWIIAAPSARFSAAFGQVGLVHDCAIPWTLPRRRAESGAIVHQGECHSG